jgi:hypothetical protein
MPWDLRGNAITGGDFLGTTNAQTLFIRTNSTNRLEIRSDSEPYVRANGSISASRVFAGLGGITTLSPSPIFAQNRALSVGTVVGQNFGGNGYGVVGRDDSAARTGFAAYFVGKVVVEGEFQNFRRSSTLRIDHPLAPAEKYLDHTSVESSEMKNVYDGVAQLDEDGAAWVELPEWFEALNKDFRYQLTAIGGAAPGLHVAEEIADNRFRIAGGTAGMKVCWQVSGIRNDPGAAANPFEAEQEKPEEERGRYLDPSLYGASEEQRIGRAVPGSEEAIEHQEEHRDVQE